MKARSIFHSLRQSNFEICIHIYIFIHLNVDMIKYLSTACPSQSSFCLFLGIDYRDRKLKIIYSAMGRTLLCTFGLHEFRSVHYLSMYMFCYDTGNITLMSEECLHMYSGRRHLIIGSASISPIEYVLEQKATLGLWYIWMPIMNETLTEEPSAVGMSRWFQITSWSPLMRAP